MNFIAYLQTLVIYYTFKNNKTFFLQENQTNPTSQQASQLIIVMPQISSKWRAHVAFRTIQLNQKKRKILCSFWRNNKWNSIMGYDKICIWCVWIIQAQQPLTRPGYKVLCLFLWRNNKSNKKSWGFHKIIKVDRLDLCMSMCCVWERKEEDE